MLPDNLEGWVYLVVACGMGLVIGRWIKSRRDKANAGDEAASCLKREREYADKIARKGKGKKRSGKTGKKSRVL